MAFLNELNTIVNTATNMLLTNDNICKLIYYYPKETNLQFNPLSQSKIENPSSLLMKYIFPMPKPPDSETKQICFININIDGGGVYSNNTGFRKINLIFDVICHLDSWFIKGGYRPLKIISEIDEMFNNQQTDLPIFNKPTATSLRSLCYSNKFFGYQLVYELSINNNVECRGQ